MRAAVAPLFRRPLVLAWLLAVTVLTTLVCWSLGLKFSSVTHTNFSNSQSAPSERKQNARRDPPQQNAAGSAPQQQGTSKEKTLGPSQNLPSTSTYPSKSLSPPQQLPQKSVPILETPLGKAAIVIDDFGNDLEIAKKFLELPIPITFSVIPDQKYTAQIAQLAHAHNRQVILHLPMEPLGYPQNNPGVGALLLSMSSETIENKVKSAFDSSPYFAGMNNHMGSRFTQNPTAMRIVLTEVQRRGLFFFDSSTSPQSVAYSEAKQMQLPCIRRDIFLDHDPSLTAIRSQIRTLIRRAQVEGMATAIGHPRLATWRILASESQSFSKERISVVPLGELVK